MNRARARLAGYWNDLPRWFRAIFIVFAVLYFLAWAYGAFLAINYPGSVSIPVLPKDATEFASLSDSILTTHTFSLDGVIPETFRAPGYPAFVALVRLFTGGSFLAVTLVQIILILASALMVQRIGARYFSGTIGAIAAAIFLLNPTTLVIPLLIQTEALFIFLFLSLFLVLGSMVERRFWTAAIAGGAIAAAAIYVRPMGFWAVPMFLAPILIAKISWKKRAAAAAVAAVVLCVLVAPWMERNRQTTGVFSFSSLATQSILSYSIPMFRAHQNGTSIGTEINQEVKDVGVEPKQWRQLSFSPALQPYISGFIKKNLLQYGEYHLVISLPFFFVSDIEWSTFSYALMTHQSFQFGQAAIFDLANGDVGSFFSKITQPWWKFSERVLICLMGVCALYCLVKMRRQMVVWVFAGIIVFLALVNAGVADARHRFPADPLIYLLTSSGIVLFLDSRSRNTPSRRRPFLYRV